MIQSLKSASVNGFSVNGFSVNGFSVNGSSQPGKRATTLPTNGARIVDSDSITADQMKENEDK